MSRQQSGVFRGVYEFEDSSGSLIAARVPASGATDLYSGTKLIVRPNQVAMLVYNGKVADIFFSGNHELKTDNVPIVTKLLNWKFGFQSSFLAEIWFFGIQVYTARRWGTTSPIIAPVNNSPMPLRAYGTYNFRIKDARKIFDTLIGSRTYLDVSQVEEFIQSQMLERLPQCLGDLPSVQELGKKQKDIAESMEQDLNKFLLPYGIEITDIQLTSILPPKEIMEALEERIAMELIGDKRDYLLYKTADALENLKGGTGDSAQLMMGMMMGQGFFGNKNEAAAKAEAPKALPGSKFCTKCGQKVEASAKFCASCGEQVKS